MAEKQYVSAILQRYILIVKCRKSGFYPIIASTANPMRVTRVHRDSTEDR